MSNRTFTWLLSYGTDQDATPRVNEARFGDGYSQAVADGINALAMTWSLNFTYRAADETDEILGFLADHGGYDTFWWRSVVDGQPKRVLCRSWRTRQVGPGQYQLEMRFEQRFDRDPATFLDIDFSDYLQTLLTPSDTAVLLPVSGDAEPAVPIPYLGLYLPAGGRIALEGADGGVAPLDLPPGTVFTGMVPRRLLARGTDSGAVVYGLSHPTITALPDYTGDRVLHVVLSDSVDLAGPAVGGIYSAGGGSLTYATAGGTATATLPPMTWLANPAAVITRINATGTDAGFSALAFVRARSIPLSPLTFGEDGEDLQFTNDGSNLVFGS